MATVLFAGGGPALAPPPAAQAAAASAAVTVAPATSTPDLPSRLSETGFFAADPQRFAYSPQYPLWSDGAAKRRFCALPQGQAIDASRPDDWELPVGTRFWKEFSFAGQRVETRFSEKLPSGKFRFGTYLWDATQTDAVLVAAEGARGVRELAPGVRHDVPSRADCSACHDGRRSGVLGFGALQLSSDRDPLAAHAETPSANALDLRQLVQLGLVRNLPPRLLDRPPRIAARSATARAALGYLFGNCSGCHNQRGPLADVGLDFDQLVGDDDASARALDSSVGVPSRFHLPGEHHSQRIRPGSPERSAVWFRMSHRDGGSQMPPLGTKLVDRTGTDLVARFIARDLDPSHFDQQGKP